MQHIIREIKQRASHKYLKGGHCKQIPSNAESRNNCFWFFYHGTHLHQGKKRQKSVH